MHLCANAPIGHLDIELVPRLNLLNTGHNPLISGVAYNRKATRQSEQRTERMQTQSQAFQALCV
jgi:hypothetical protein